MFKLIVKCGGLGGLKTQPNQCPTLQPGASVVAIVVLLLAAFLMPYLNTGYTSNDDMVLAYTPYSGFVQIARDQGRVCFMSLLGL